MTVRPLNPELQKRAEEDVNEKSSRVSSDIKALREWLRKQPHLSSVKPSDQWLVVFLRGCKFSLERAKEKLDMYYTLRSIVPEFFGDRDPMNPKIQLILKLGIFLPLRNCSSPDSPRICIHRIGVIDTSKFHLSDIIKISYMITEILMLEDDHFGVAGEELIIDLKDVGVSIISQWTPGLAKKSVMSFEKAVPVRLKRNHIMNTPPGFEAAYSVLKMFISDKLKKRMKVHNQNFEALYRDIPKSILPFEYGGEDGSLQDLIDYWKEKVESYREWFLEQAQQRSDEAKRPGKPKSSSEMFGIEGSFRKLDVD